LFGVEVEVGGEHGVGGSGGVSVADAFAVIAEGGGTVNAVVSIVDKGKFGVVAGAARLGAVVGEDWVEE